MVIESRCQGVLFREAMEKPWGGEILLVTHNGWYLRTEQGVFLLHDAKYGEIPIGVALPDIGNLPYDKQLEHERIFFENGRIGVSADLNILVYPSGERKKLSVNVVSASWIDTLRDILKTPGRGDLKYSVCDMKVSERGLFQETIAQRTKEFLSAVDMGTTDSISTAVKNMLGLGMGLTPGCDDFLVGYLYASYRTGKLTVHRTVGDAVLRYADECTNEISAAYLRAAAQCKYYELLESCLFEESMDNIVRLLSVGSSSGSDMLSGLLAACADF